uniref:Uncharacterized protein n=1 Tax=Oryza brachyantha TaxID=4533 RepID=J3LAN8_ORYBR
MIIFLTFCTFVSSGLQEEMKGVLQCVRGRYETEASYIYSSVVNSDRDVCGAKTVKLTHCT